MITKTISKYRVQNKLKVAGHLNATHAILAQTANTPCRLFIVHANFKEILNNQDRLTVDVEIQINLSTGLYSICHTNTIKNPSNLTIKTIATLLSQHYIDNDKKSAI